MSKMCGWVAGIIIAFNFSGLVAFADTLDAIKKKGVIVVGTKVDFAPFGYKDPQGNTIGLEPDLAADVAKRLGVKLELVPVTSANRMAFLQEGKIDLMIATMSVTDEREKVVGIIKPHYYATRISVIARKDANMQDEADLKGQKICSLSGAFFNPRLQAEFTHQDLVLYKSIPEIEAALAQKQCVGFVFDEVLLIYKKRTEAEKWRDYDLIELTEFDPVPWGMAVRLEEKNTAWGKFVSGVVTDWLRSETLLTLEHKWLSQNTTWLKAVHIRMSGAPR
jgi:polar amino acid transport system substrate-binding protein